MERRRNRNFFVRLMLIAKKIFSALVGILGAIILLAILICMAPFAFYFSEEDY